jgi:hypothetical protein
MFKKLVITSFLVLASAFSFAGESVDVEIGCVIEGHGGGCFTEALVLESVAGAASLKATITDENCYEDEFCDFCTTTNVSEFTSNKTQYLPLNMEEGYNALIVKAGLNEVRVNFYDAKGSYITTQFLDINITVGLEY